MGIQRFFGVSPLVTEELLKKEFEEIHPETGGKISKDEAIHLLQNLGKSDEEIEYMLNDLTTDDMTFPELQGVLKKAPKLPNMIHDVPVVGIMTSAFSDTFNGALKYNPSPDEMRIAFDQIDTKKTGKLDKTDITAALRHLGNSERQVQKIMDSITQEELDFESFVGLIHKDWRPWTYKLGPVPVPNHEKVLDVPVLGHTLCFFGDLLAQPTDGLLRSSWRFFHPATEALLVRAFKIIDTDKSGKLSKKELATALRNWGRRESEITRVLNEMKGEDMNFYEFKVMLRGPRFSQSPINHIPVVGPPLVNNVTSTFEEDIPDHDEMKEAFDYIDRDKNGKLSKTELTFVLRELGQSEVQIQRVIESMEEEEMDFDAFKNQVEQKSRTWLTQVGGVPMPNPAKIHDVPLVGNCTGLIQDLVLETYDWTIGLAIRKYAGCTDKELKEKFDEIDTDKSGKLSKKELSKVLRNLGKTEREITCIYHELGDHELSFEEFKAFVQGPSLPQDDNHNHID